MKDTKEEINNQDKTKKNTAKSIINIIIITIFTIFIIFEAIIGISYFKNKNNTISIFGKIPYITLFSDDEYGFKNNDVIVAKDINKVKPIVIKLEDKRNTVIKTGKRYNYEQKENVSRDVFYKKIHGLGKCIMFIKQWPITITVVVFIIAIYTLIYVLRQNNNDKYTKKYKKIRHIKDIVITLFIILAYFDIFLIGTVDNKFSDGTEDPYMMEYEDNENENDNTKSDQNVVDTQINFLITENDVSWKDIKDLSIFDNRFWHSNKICPGISGRYKFNVENKSNCNVKYKIDMKSLNNYNINLQYRILKNGEYINKDYADIEKIEIPEYQLAINEKDVYTIEWRWPYETNNEVGNITVNDKFDTVAGENAKKAEYKLQISVGISET